PIPYTTLFRSRAAALATTLSELADVLAASGVAHSADALRTYFSYARLAHNLGREPKAAEARRQTVKEFLLLTGSPVKAELKEALVLGQALTEYYRARTDPRSQAMAATFAAETHAVTLHLNMWLAE